LHGAKDITRNLNVASHHVGGPLFVGRIERYRRRDSRSQIGPTNLRLWTHGLRVGRFQADASEQAARYSPLHTQPRRRGFASPRSECV